MEAVGKSRGDVSLVPDLVGERSLGDDAAARLTSG
jgi:hypothetical protein